MSGTRETVGLVASGAHRERIAALLERERLAVMFLAEEPSAAAVCLHERPSPVALVVWVGDASTSLASAIEPLAGLGLPLVVAGARIERWEVRAALAAGAAGVVTEDALETSLGACMRAALAGHVSVPREHWRQVDPPVLSTREKQILGLVVMGYMNSQIAEQLFLAESTVKSHLSSAFGKLGVRSRNQAVDLILSAERGFGMGILGIESEPLQPISSAAS